MKTLHSQFSAQSGAVLAISLIMLLLLTLIGVTGTQVTTMEERMAGNTRDQNIAFQATETSLREAESWIAVQSPRPLTSSSPSSSQVWSLNSPASAGTETWWQERDVSWWSNNAVQATAALNNVTTNPYYIIEQQYFDKDSLTVGMGSDSSGRVLYRVTARGTGGNDTTRILLQSTYSKRF